MNNNSKLDFNGSTLYVSPRSPFARRVGLALWEHDIKFESKMVEVWHPQPELRRKNPLARVPTLILADGTVLIDSNLILQIFYESSSSPLMQAHSQSDRLEIFEGRAFGIGLCETAIESYMESLRPEGHKDRALMDELAESIECVLQHLERRLAGKSGAGLFYAGNQISQADLDLGSGLGYLHFRFPERFKNYPQVSRYLNELYQRKSFQRTMPMQSAPQ